MAAKRSRWRSQSLRTSSARCQVSEAACRRPAVREILFVAGEVSGDSHAAAVARELVARRAPYQLTGVGGDQMRAAGIELIQHIEKLAVMGLVEVIEHIPRLWALMN